MSDQAWDLDFTKQTVSDADIQNAAIPDDWYRVKLIKVEDNQKSGSKELTFRIIHGSLTGRIFREFLNNPQLANTAEAAAFAQKKAMCYSSRLGLVSDDANGKQVRVAFSTAVGKDFVVHLHTRKGEKKDFQSINFDIYPIGHKSIKPEIAHKLGLQAAPVAGTATAGGAAGAAVTPPGPTAAPPADPKGMADMLWGKNPGK